MPHFIIEYSTNIEDKVEIPELLEKLHNVAVETGVFPLGGLRSRVIPVDQYRIADGHPDNAFVHVSMRVGSGRERETLVGACERIFEVITDHFGSLQETSPLALSYEIRQMDKDLNFRKTNIREHMAKRAGKEA
jgi:5-carboxymethyl-2-hydroxymuconate isomerase